MKLFTCTDHEGVWPVGVASIVIAENEEQARTLLDAELASRKLLSHYTLNEVDISTPQAIVLKDGDY